MSATSAPEAALSEAALTLGIEWLSLSRSPEVSVEVARRNNGSTVFHKYLEEVFSGVG